MAAHQQLSRVPRNLGELAAIPANAGTHTADWVLGTSINFLIDEEQSVLEAEKQQCEEAIAGLEATREETAQQLLWHRHIPRRLSQLNDALQYGAVNDPVPQTLAYLRAVRNGPVPPVIPSSPQIHPMHVEILEILLHNLDGVRETVTLRLFEDRFTTEYISDGLRKKLRLDAKISPRFYIKSVNAHKYTNNGTKWELVSTTQSLERDRRELHVVLRTRPYTLVLLGHEWRWKADRTQVLDCDIARDSLEGIRLRRFHQNMEVDQHGWPTETDHYHCNVYGQIKSLHRTRLVLRDMGSRIRTVL